MTPQPTVAVDTVWNRKGENSTGRVEVLAALEIAAENWVRVRHLDMPAARTKAWWALEARFLKLYEPADL